jgi:hypothetical protein
MVQMKRNEGLIGASAILLMVLPAYSSYEDNCTTIIEEFTVVAFVVALGSQFQRRCGVLCGMGGAPISETFYGSGA